MLIRLSRVSQRAWGIGRKISINNTGRRLRPVPCKLFPDPPRDGIIRTSPGQECSKDKGALPGMRGILFIQVLMDYEICTV